MKLDVLIEYNKALNELTFSSQTAKFTQTRTGFIGLSRGLNDDSNCEQIEFIGEDWETFNKIKDLWTVEPIKDNRSFRIIAPFLSTTFEPQPAFYTISHFATYILATIYPKSYGWRMVFSWLDSYDLKLIIPEYNLFEP